MEAGQKTVCGDSSCASQLVSQSVSQSVSESVSLSVSQSVSHLVSRQSVTEPSVQLLSWEFTARKEERG